MSCGGPCTGAPAGQSSDAARNLAASLDQAWPVGMPFPPFAPWIGTIVTRANVASVLASAASNMSAWDSARDEIGQAGGTTTASPQEATPPGQFGCALKTEDDSQGPPGTMNLDCADVNKQTDSGMTPGTYCESLITGLYGRSGRRPAGLSWLQYLFYGFALGECIDACEKAAVMCMHYGEGSGNILEPQNQTDRW